MYKLRFDGYYYYLKKNIIKIDSYNYILRFFEKNNKVIGVTVSPQKDDIIVGFGDFFPSGIWFNENYENNGILTFQEIRFILNVVKYYIMEL